MNKSTDALVVYPTMGRSKSRKNVVFMTAIDGGDHALDYFELTLKTWIPWCKQHDVILFVQRKPAASVLTMTPPWQRHFAFDLLDEHDIDYDQIAVLDIDTMIRWDAPDFFALTGRQWSAVAEDGGARSLGFVVQRLSEFQPFFPGVVVPWWEYFNGGMFVFNRSHRHVFDKSRRFHDRNRAQIARLVDPTKMLPHLQDEQTVLNFLLRKHRIPVRLLPPPFNLSQLRGKGWLAGGRFIDLGYIWHFNGFDKEERLGIMRHTWKSIARHYRSGRQPGVSRRPAGRDLRVGGREA